MKKPQGPKNKACARMNEGRITVDDEHTARLEGARQIADQMLRTFSAPLLADSNPRRFMASMLLMAAELQDRKVSKDDSLIRARLAAKLVEQFGDLDFSIWLVLLAIETNDKRFFIDFGKCLSSEIKDPTLFDKRDRDIAEIVACNPEMSAKQAVRELEKRGHRGITEDNFRMWKMRLLKAKPFFDELIAYFHNKITPLAVTDNSE